MEKAGPEPSLNAEAYPQYEQSIRCKRRNPPNPKRAKRKQHHEKGNRVVRKKKKTKQDSLSKL